MAGSPKYDALRDAMFLQAALADEFRPRDLMADVVPAEERGNILLRGQLMSALREQCSTRGDYWQLRPIARRKVLEDRPALDDLPDNEIASALKGEHQYTDDALDEMIQQDAPLDRLSLVVTTLERAGPNAKGHDKLLALSSKLDRARGEHATDSLLADGFVGRQRELDALLAALDAPCRTAPLKNLHIQGMPGVGKTFLLEQLSKLCRDRPHIVLVRLDFDRSALSNGAVEAIFDEISRQVGAALPHRAADLHRLRLEAAERRTWIASNGVDTVPFDLLHGMIDILVAADRQLVFLLDTLEVLHRHGATFVARLMRQIDRFADKEQLDITVISAGRGPIFDPEDKALGAFIPLDKLDREVTQAILIKRGVPEELHDEIIELSRGNPLRLTLVTRALEAQEDAEAIGADEVRVADNGYLYRAILSRVPAPIRQIAAEGLILPALGAEELTQIVAPALGLTIDFKDAGGLLDMLEQQRWMVERDAERKIRQLEHVRREMLDLTYAERAEETRLINVAAVAYYSDRDPLMLLYHRLQLMRAGGDVPDIDAAIARQLSQSMLADLLGSAQDSVLRAQGARSRVAQSAPEEAAPPLVMMGAMLAQKHVPAKPPEVLCIWSPPNRADGRLQLVEGDVDGAPADPGGLDDLRNMLESQEQGEATFLIKQLLAQPVRFEGHAARLALTHQWQTGHWSMARSLLDLIPDAALDEAIENDLHLTGLAMLEAWAEFRFERLCDRLGDEEFAGTVRVALNLTERLGLRGGALAMAMLAATGDQYLIEDTGINMLDRYLPEGLIGFDRLTAERSAAIRGAFGLLFDVGKGAPTDLSVDQLGLLAAPLNPYIGPLMALLDDLTGNPDRKILRDFGALREHLMTLNAHLTQGVTGMSWAASNVRPDARDIAELIGAAGLTAELTGAYSFYSPVPDLPTIADAAMRWLNASLGRWTYDGKPPKGWKENPVDPLALSRTNYLLDLPRSLEAAIDLLTLWDDPSLAKPNPPAPPKKLRSTFAALDGATSPEDSIATLQKTNVPSALWPSLATLRHLGLKPDDLF